jgi:midasin
MSTDPHDLDRNPQAQNHHQGNPGDNASTQEALNALADIDHHPDQSDTVRPDSRKSLADALSEVQRRYEKIQQYSSEEEPRQRVPDPDVYHMEHTEEDATDTKLALAPAGEDEVTKPRDLNIVDDKPDRLPDNDTDLLDSDEPEPVLGANFEAELNDKRSKCPNSSNDAENAVTGESVRREHLGSLSGIPAQADTTITSEEVEARLISWHGSNERRESVDAIWRLYSSLTHELAWTLCEQLRLILEPTKATRLRGDYRTGKRLNMRKIIPYIASEYTKDKIWLRRTRPSQREFQILLALDDSRSMSESHAEHLAFQTLALVSKALTRLEAGEMSVVKFGETVDIIHGFSDGPFNDAAGARTIGSFGFNQTSTDVLSLVETSLTVLQKARERRGDPSSLNATLWQLEIIISDGICSNHDRLRAALRRASEQKVMIVFVIVDALSRSNIGGQSNDREMQNSILSMKQVRADLSVERYLDTFPFEYYVVLRSVDALPDVLSATLRQFFERIAEE